MQSDPEDWWVSNKYRKGPSETELAQLNQKVLAERQIFAALNADAGPTNANDWYCDVTKISFSLSKMKEAAEAEVLGGKVVLGEQAKVAMA